MGLRIGVFIFALFFAAQVSANRTNRNLNLQQLQNRCLTHQSTAVKSMTCITQKKLKMQITRGVENGVFYCLTYEKNTGNVYGFDSLTIELHPDYDLQYSGANVIDYEFPSFKLYDVRVTEDYKGRFAIFSNNTSFRIHQVTINNEPQSCMYGKGKNRQLWPEQRKTETEEEEEVPSTPKYITKSTISKESMSSTTKIPSTTKAPITSTTLPTTTTALPTVTTTEAATTTSITTVATTTSPPLIVTTELSVFTEITQKYQGLDIETTESLFTTLPSDLNITEQETNIITSNPKCGMSKKLVDLKIFSLPYNPGEFPFSASIFQSTRNGDLKFKCSGTIISDEIILTSVNCLLDHNAKIISANNLMVYVAQYMASLRNSKNINGFQVDKILIHENFNYNLDNNIAALKLNMHLEFDDFVQPICLLPPLSTLNMEETIGKVIGFGASKILSETDFKIQLEETSPIFDGNSTTTSENIDLGSGLYVSNKNNVWSMLGITSIIPHHQNAPVTFTNIVYFMEWIKRLLN